jgi:hypothetical protein
LLDPAHAGIFAPEGRKGHEANLPGARTQTLENREWTRLNANKEKSAEILAYRPVTFQCMVQTIFSNLAVIRVDSRSFAV